MDCLADAEIGSTTTQVSSHRRIDVCVGWVRVFDNQRHGLHDLPRFAVTTLRGLSRNPGALYGIGARKEPDVITVRAFAKEDLLHVEICNLTSALDGPLDKLASRGVGLANTIAGLHHLYGSKHSFVIRNLPPLGVAVSLSLPLRRLPVQTAKMELYEYSGANR